MQQTSSRSHVLRQTLALAALALTVLLGAPDAAAQALRGQVTDDTGTPVIGVNVTVPRLGVGTATDADGRYRLAGLAPDTLTVRFTAVGFEPAARRANLTGGDATLDVALRPAVEALDEVTVTEDAARARLVESARSVAVLDARELEALRGQTLGETLEALPGVTALTTGPSISKPVVRGLHSDRVVVLNGGVRQEGQQWGGEHAPEIDPFAPAEVRVVRGAAAVEYGLGAIGGVIRVEPRDLPGRPGLGGRLSLQAFSNNAQGAGSAFVEGGVPGVRGMGWRVQGSARRAAATRTPDYVVGNSGFAERSGQAAVGIHRGPVGVEALASRFDTELGLYAGAHINNLGDLFRAARAGQPRVDYDATYEIRPPKQRVTHDLATVRGHWHLPTGDRLEAQVGVQRNHRREFDAHRGADAGPAFDLSLWTTTAEAKLRHRPIGHFVGAFGVSFMNQLNQNAEAGQLIPNFRAVTGGAFWRETWLVNRRLTLEAGARYDLRWLRAFPFEGFEDGFVAREHRYASPSAVLGAIYELAPAWSLAANVGTAWRPPSVNELYSDGVHHGTAQFERGDPDLGPERSLDASLTLRHESALASAEVSVYNNRIADFVYLVPETGADGEIRARQTIRGAYWVFDHVQDDAVLRGLDADVTVRPVPGLDLSATVSLVRGTNLDANRPLFGMPADRAGIGAEVALPEAGPFRAHAVGAGLRLVREQTEVPGVEVLRDDGGRNVLAPPPGYALLDLSYDADLRLGGLDARLGVGVSNLLDTAYRDYLSRFRYYIDGPGRNVTARLSVPFGRTAR